jgi:glycosyltransferase involved in cell wall biosynthesis
MNIALITAGSLMVKKESTWLTITQLAREYTEQGHQVYILAHAYPGLPKVEFYDGIPIYRMFGQKSERFGFATRLLAMNKTMKELNKQNIHFDIIHSFSAAPLMALEVRLAKKKNVKWIHTSKSYSKHFSGKFLKSMLNLPDAVIFPTLVAARNQSTHRAKASIIRSSIDLKKFKPRNKIELKKKYDLADKKVILYYGAIREQKGVDHLIQAIPEIINKFPNTRFIFAVRSQEVEARDNYLTVLEKLGCKQHVQFILEDVKIEEYVSMADAVVLAYPNLIATEGNPSCLLESMASKTAVVTTSLPELQEIVTHDKEVLMAKPGDVPSLIEQINRLLANPILEKNITENAFLISKQFDIKVISGKYLELYGKLTNTNS